MKTSLLPKFITLLIVLCFLQLTGKAQRVTYEKVSDVLRDHILREANWALGQPPITVTAETSSRSAGNKHCFFSEGDYWWPDPENPDGPYIQRDGMTNPENFVAHRKAMIRFSKIVGALVSAYLITGEERYIKPVVIHLQAWFVSADTYMEPHLNFAQAIKGRVTGRGIGIIDTIHLMEVAQSIIIMMKYDLLDLDTKQKVVLWFEQYLQWLKTSAQGIEEMNAQNNHGTCWVMQVASFAKLVNDRTTLSFCSDRYKSVLLPNQMAKDGSFPLELKRTKPYGYSIFNLDAMSMICQMLSTPNDDLWTYKTADGRSMKKGVEFLVPFIKNKSLWSFPKDVMYWESWPVAQPAIVFAAQRFDEQDWFQVWQAAEHSPDEAEVIRNLPIRHPLLWINKPSRK
jgi:hypothetical protein